MTAERPVQRRHRGRPSRRVLPTVGLALVALALFGAFAPVAAVKASPRPEPTELWRQFPLETERSKPVGGAERGPAASKPAPTTGQTAGEARTRPFSTLQIAAVVVGLAFLLILMTGVLAHAGHGPLAPAIRRRERRLERSFRDFLDAPRSDPIPRQRVAVVPAAVRRAKRTAEADVNALGDAAGRLYARLLSEVGALKTHLAARMSATQDELRSSDELGALERDRYSDADKNAGAPDAPPETPKATRGEREAPARSPADDELEILKAKLGKPGAPVDDDHVEEVETLKAKLSDDAAKTTGEEARRDQLKRKLADRWPLVDAVPRKKDDLTALKAKLELADRTAKDEIRAVGDLETHDLETLRQPRPAGARVSQPNTVLPASRRFPTLAASARPASPRREAAGRPEQPLSLNQALASRCRIIWWRGYFKSQFLAVARSPAGQDEVLAESPHFRWGKAEPPPGSPTAVEAHRSLVDALERDGWSVAGSGEHWFMVELERGQPRRRLTLETDET
jgi:hypothetical protein